MTIGELGFDFEYIIDKDREEYRKFCIHHLQNYDRAPVQELWHYTTADGLMAILRTGKIFSTQVTCLNDTLEQRYFGDLVYNAVKPLLATNTDADFGICLKIAEADFIRRDFASTWHFVNCFSEASDDLGQWRGYGRGDCGYAIGFRYDGLLDAIKRRQNAILLPMQYSASSHQAVVDDVLRMAKIYFHAGIIKRNVIDTVRWANEFLIAFAWQLDIFASITKHPKFAGEMEHPGYV